MKFWQAVGAGGLGLDSGQQSLIGRYVVPGERWYLIADFVGLAAQV